MELTAKVFQITTISGQFDTKFEHILDGESANWLELFQEKK
jgi:hypothetical protein